MKRNVELHTVNGTVVKGDRYLFPGNERHPIIITKPSGNKGAATKQNHVAWDEISGSAIYMEPPKVYKDKPSAQHVIDVVSNQFNSGFGNKLDGHDSRIPIKAPVQETANPSHDTTDVSKKGENVDTAKPDSFVSAPDGSKTTGNVGTPKNLVSIAVSRKGGNKAFSEIGNVSNDLAEKIKAETGIDVSGYTHSLDESAVRHTMEKHGDHVSESNRGQIAVTHKDFENIANVISNPDSVIKGKEDNTIEVSKRIGEHIYVVQEIRTRRKKLAVMTMWKKPLSAHDAPQNESSAETPKTYGKQASPSDKSIVQSPENAIAEKLTTKGTVVADKAESNIHETDKGTALFSRASVLSDNAKPVGITESQANAAIATFKRDFGNIDGVEFKVYKTLSDAVGETEAKKIGRVKGFYLPNSKTIAIIRDALHHVQDAAETLRHETLGHFGLNLLRPADKLAFLGDIARSRNNRSLRKMFANQARYYPEAR